MEPRPVETQLSALTARVHRLENALATQRKPVDLASDILEPPPAPAPLPDIIVEQPPVLAEQAPTSGESFAPGTEFSGRPVRTAAEPGPLFPERRVGGIGRRKYSQQNRCTGTGGRAGPVSRVFLHIYGASRPSRDIAALLSAALLVSGVRVERFPDSGPLRMV